MTKNKKLVVFLIQKELEATKLVQELERIGFDRALFTPALDEAVFPLLGINDEDHDFLTWYFESLEKYAAPLQLGNIDAARKAAKEFYAEVVRRVNL